MALTDEAITKIRAMIQSGELPRCARLPPEPQLAAQVGLSRGGVREAVKVQWQELKGAWRVISAARAGDQLVASSWSSTLRSGLVCGMTHIDNAHTYLTHVVLIDPSPCYRG